MRGYRVAAAAAVVVALCGLFASSSSGTSSINWPTYLFDNQHSSYNSAATSVTPANAGTLTPVWMFDGPTKGPPPGVLYASPTVYDGKIYVGSNSGEFYRIDEATGTVDWHENLGTSPHLTCRGKGILSTAAVAIDPTTGVQTVYVGAGDGNVDALRASDGAVLWQTPVNVDSATENDKYNFSSPLVDRGRVYEGISSSCDQPLTRGGLVELDQSTGALIDTYYTVPEGSVGGSIWSSPAVTADGSSIFVTTGNGDPTAGADQGDSISIVRLDADTLTKQDIWTIPDPIFDGDFGGSPTLFTATLNNVSTPMVGAMNKDGIYYAWKQDDLASGPVWQNHIGVGGVSAAIWDGQHLFVASQQATIGGVTYAGAMRELDPSTGQPLWETPLTAGGVGFGTPTMDGAGVIGVVTYDPTADASNVAYLLSASDGSILRTISLTSPTFAQPVFADQYLFVTDGAAADLYAYAAPVSDAADFSVEQTPSVNPVVTDRRLTYTVTVTNSGTSAAATLTDTPPTGVIVDSATPSQGSCTGTNPVSCSFGAIDEGQSAVLTLVVTPIVPGVLTNTTNVTPVDATPSDNTSTVTTSARPQAKTKYVSVDDSGFAPGVISTKPGQTIQWSFFSAGHSAVDAALLGCSGTAPCPLFVSDPEPNLGYYRRLFFAAGTYQVADAASSNLGTVRVRPQITPASGSVADTFTVLWASQNAGPDQAYDIQIKTPGSTSWTAWLTGATTASGPFDSTSPGWAGAGTYRFRTRLRNSSTGNASGYSSPSRTLTIS